MPEPDYNLTRLAERIAPGSTLVRSWPLQGGVSSSVVCIELEHADGRSKRLVVRRHGPHDLARDPRIAEHEFELLNIAQSAGLPVPSPICFVPPNSSEKPCLVIDYVEGRTEFAPRDLDDYLAQLAGTLAQIHAIRGLSNDLAFLPRRTSPPMLAGSSGNQPSLLHGDFWPGNVLWRDGRVVAVIDWEDAAIGDPLADLARTSLELALAFDIDTAESFTASYAALTTVDLSHLATWEIQVAGELRPKIAEWGLSPSAERAMYRKHQAFLERTLAKLAD